MPAAFVLGAAASVGLVASVHGAGMASATCLAAGNTSFGSGCSASGPLSTAVALGPHATATANGFNNHAMAMGVSASATAFGGSSNTAMAIGNPDVNEFVEGRTPTTAEAGITDNQGRTVSNFNTAIAVSYTHLTLPTIA